MEQRRESHSSMWMMIVGIIFIVTAGSIFVSTAWKYLPDLVKAMILLAGSVGMLFGSKRLDDKSIMKKTEATLYYLGTAFAGLGTIALLNDFCVVLFDDNGYGWNENAVVLATILVLVLLGKRFYQKRGTIDFIFVSLIAGWLSLYAQISYQTGWTTFAIASTVELGIYVFADLFGEKWQRENKCLEIAFFVMYVIKVIMYLMLNLIFIVFEDNMTGAIHGMIVTTALVVFSHWIYKEKTDVIFRVINSIAWFGAVIALVSMGNEILHEINGFYPGDDRCAFIAYILGVVVAVACMRVEMLYTMLAFGMLAPFVQVLNCAEGSSEVVACYPYSAVLIGGMAVAIYRSYKACEIDCEEMKRLAYAAGLQLVNIFLVMLAVGKPSFTEASLGVIAVQMLTIACIVKNTGSKKILQTISLFFADIFFIILGTDLFEIANYNGEYVCGCLAVAVFLLGVIWGNGKGIKMMQFICNCLLMFILLSGAWLTNGVEHALIVGLVGAAILVGAAVLQSRRYVVMASVVLILLVLYVTRAFWLSIAWWVYLFVVGVAFVVFAIKKESAERE